MRDWVCWGLIAGSVILSAVVSYDLHADLYRSMSDLHRLAEEVNAHSDLDLEITPPEPPRFPIEILVFVGAAVVIIVSARWSERWRRRVRVPEPANGRRDTYLVAFTLFTVAVAAGPVLFPFLGWPARAFAPLGVAAALLYVAVRCGSIRIPLQEWGWRRGRGIGIEVGIGLVAGLGLVLVTRLMPTVVAAPDSFDGSLALVALGWAPIAEETLFRGTFYTHLRSRWRWPIAVLLSTAVFAALHGSVWRSPAVAVLGTGLALLREWRGSLLAPVAAHLVANAGALYLLGALG